MTNETPQLKFEDFNLHESVMQALDFMQFKNPTPIQQAAIPVILSHKDIIACAQTGTGKTAAFILPTLHKLATEQHGKTHTLILVPTRELAMQIDQQLQGLAYFCEASCIAIYGGGDGSNFDNERKALEMGADIVVATPGRLISHISNGFVDFTGLKMVILDEADRMLDIGFYDDIMRIMKQTPAGRQCLMFSATMAPKIRKLAKEILNEPTEINLAVSKPAEGVSQEIYVCHEHQKQDLVKHFIKSHIEFKSMLVFCSTKKKVEQLARLLERAKFNVQAISSDYEQNVREQVLLDFRSRKIQVLVATDVLSRGIDIKDIDLVINYDVPGDAEDYVHRVGRTARAASKGLAITLVNQDDMLKFNRIERFVEKVYDKLPLPEGFEPGPPYEVISRPKNKRKGFSKFKKKKPFKKPTEGGTTSQAQQE